MKSSKTILWDWNGTMLNDMSICIDAMNLMLRERELKLLDEEVYRDVFTFPVRDYYSKIGFDFDKEPFEKPALEFIENYDDMVREARIFSDTNMALDTFRSRGYTQMILSAMQNDFLNELVRQHGIAHYFDEISGIDDHYASGKVENARKLIAGLEGKAGETVMIGDTIHDHEVGEELGIRVILVSRGHQSEERIRSTGREIAHNFREVIQIIN
ncbi:MAG: HAD family hydrolase [Bacteroidales bacterium]|jgi:phosphoglycolate phosphatase|nr:HAD family hydrolase [Bacteroidales bacterium]